MRFLFCGALFLAFLAIAFTPALLDAGWPPDGLVVCDEDLRQEKPKVVSDGAGGAIVAWTDWRMPDKKVYAQRIDGSGIPYWDMGGVHVSGSGERVLMEMVSDGVNGAILIFGGTGEMRAQRIDGSCNLLWGVDGAVIPASNDESVVAAPDGSGGIILAFDMGEVYAQRLDRNGNVIWDGGGGSCIRVSVSSGDAFDPCIASDGAGGALIAFYNDYTGEEFDGVYANRVFSSGSVWSSSGTFLYSSDPESHPAIAGDGCGGAIVTWQTTYGGSGDFNIVAQRADASGAVQWGGPFGDPVMISDSGPEQAYPDILSDGCGGAYIVWQDDQYAWDIYAQRIDAMGNCLWTANGVPVCNDGDDQMYPRLLECGGGFIVVWSDWRESNHLAAQKVDISGGSVWTDDGVPIVTGITDFGDYDSAADEGGGLLSAIMDVRGTTGEDIYAQALNNFGDVASPEPDITNVEDVPGDQGGAVRITVSRSERDDNRQTLEQVARYDVWQRVDDPPAMLISSEVLGPGGIPDGSSAGACGAVVMESEGSRYLLTAPSAVNPDGTWELIGSFDATQSDEYTYRVTTLADSSASGIPYSRYVVSAHTTNPAVWYVSEPDSGYSVDNLAPDPPLGLAGEQSQSPEGLRLTWDQNNEDDLWYYAVYRGASEEFTAGPGSLVATPTDEEWFDNGWNWEEGFWYKVSAVDENGNESDVAVLGPNDVTGGDHPPATLADFLRQNHPNPFNPSTVMTFGLKSAVHVSLRIYNATGQLVKTLVDREFDAGVYHERWDGKDDEGHPSASGIYFYRLVAGGFVQTRKMVLLR